MFFKLIDREEECLSNQKLISVDQILKAELI